MESFVSTNTFERRGDNIYELFGLGRFAKDHSLTKAASRPLFVRVRTNEQTNNN